MLASEAVQFQVGFGPWTVQSGSGEPEMGLTPEEERRSRRMISNRESARRSRMRKQRHLEGLRAQVVRLMAENRELTGRITATAHRCLLFRRDNHRLCSESAHLRLRLAEIRQILPFRPLQRLAPALATAACGGFASGNEPSLASLIA